MPHTEALIGAKDVEKGAFGQKCGSDMLKTHIHK